MLDIHTHLYWESYDKDRDEVVERAREAGVRQMIVVGTTPEENLLAIGVAERYDDMFASVGLHPHFFNEVEENTQPKSQNPNKTHNPNHKLQKEIEELKKLAKHPKVVAIGECGLDYFSHDVSKIITERQKATQKEGYIAQLELAQELGLPVIIHTRPSAGNMDAYEDVFSFLQATSYPLRPNFSEASQLPAVLHCYMGDTEITKKFLTVPNVYFSFTGNITYPIKQEYRGTKDDLTETVKMIPTTRLFVETDCPFLTPQKKRGKRNEPAYVQMVAEQICTIKGIEMVDFEAMMEKNFQVVFRRYQM